MSDDIKTKLKAAREAKAARLEAKAEADDALELQFLELEEKFEKDLSGPRGSKFEILDLRDLCEGFVVVRLGESVLYKRFKNSKMTDDDARELVLPCVVYPTVDEFKALLLRRDAVLGRVANAAGTLHGLNLKAETGKF